MDVNMTKLRSDLDALDYPSVGLIPETELETWLLKPGPNRYRVFEWALRIIDPATSKDYLHAADENIEKVTTKLLVDYGLCRSSDTDIIVGQASVKEQMLLWQKVFKQCHLMKGWDKLASSQTPNQPDYFQLLSSLFSSTDFWDLLEKKPKLQAVPYPGIPVETLEHLHQQLEVAKEELREACTAVAEFSEDQNQTSSARNLSECTSVHSSCNANSQVKMNIEDRGEYIAQRRKQNDEFYKKLKEQLIPAIQKQPRDLAADQLGEMVKNLAPKLEVYAHFIKERDEIKAVTSSFLNKPIPENISGSENNLSEFVSSMLEEISGILALLCINQDVLSIEPQ